MKRVIIIVLFTIKLFGIDSNCFLEVPSEFTMEEAKYFYDNMDADCFFPEEESNPDIKVEKQIFLLEKKEDAEDFLLEKEILIKEQEEDCKENPEFCEKDMK